MNKLMAILLMMSLLSVSCNKSGGDSNDVTAQTTETVTGDDTNTDTDTPDDNIPSPVTDLPAGALSFTTNVELFGFTGEQEDKYTKAAEIVKEVIATEEFRDKVLNYTYNGAKQFADNKGLTNAQIYQSILDAAETLQPAKNNRLDIEVELYYENSTVVGYTNGSTKRIFVNTKYFDQFAANSVAGNLMHEWLHKLGYPHDVAATAKRPYSVPYAIGYLVRTIGAKFL
jgi:hypothetical protein